MAKPTVRVAFRRKGIASIIIATQVSQAKTISVVSKNRSLIVLKLLFKIAKKIPPTLSTPN
jgi:hypothetical protein